MLAPFECLCGNFILPEPASYVFFYDLFNLRKLLYLIRMTKQVQELRLRWSQESFWQEGQARGAVRVCKVMGLDQADTCEYLRALLPELPQADAERLIRYY